MRFIDNAFGRNFFFHSNFSFKSSVIHQFPTFYANFLQSWKKNLSRISYTPSCVGSQLLLLKDYITIDNNSVHHKEFLSYNIKFTNHVFTSEEEFKDWNHIKREFQLTNNLCLRKFHTQFLKCGKKYQKKTGLYSILIYEKIAYPLHSSILTFYSQISD